MGNNKLFNKVNKKWILHGIGMVLKILTSCLYLGINIMFIWYGVSDRKFPSLAVWNNTKYFIMYLCVTLILPGLLIGFLFIKKSSIFIKICKGIIQAGLLVILPMFYVIGLLTFRGVLPSYTNDPANFSNRDDDVVDAISKYGLGIIPEELPNSISDIDYSYYYSFDIDYKKIDVSAAWKFNHVADYEHAKAEMLKAEGIDSETDENGYHISKVHTDLNYSSSLPQEADMEMGYNDENNRVLYRIRYAGH